MSPQRIQRKRTKGWRMPENTIYVGRPSRWGNPFSVQRYGLLRSLELYRVYLSNGWKKMPVDAYDDIRHWCISHEIVTATAVKLMLKGSDLACWCPLDQPCHADILLQLANEVTA